MKIFLLSALLVLAGCVSKQSDFPDISKFKMTRNCEEGTIPQNVLLVKLYVLKDNPEALYNEFVTTIIPADRKRQFATRVIIEWRNTEKLQVRQIETHKLYVKSDKSDWEETKNSNQFVADVINAVPEKYRQTVPPQDSFLPPDNLVVYQNILNNTGCSTESPLGALP